MADENTENLENSGPDEATVKEAREMGWTPQDKFKGDPEKWVDADEFVRRGEHLMPILRKTNNRLKGELASRDREIDKLREQTENMQATLDRLDSHYSAANKRAAEGAIAGLKAQLKQAREDQDIDKETELLDQIGLAQNEVRRITEEETKSKEKKPEGNKDNSNNTRVDPEMQAWQKENPWFGEDKKRTRQFNLIATDLREELNDSDNPDKYTPVEFLEKCSELWDAHYGESGATGKTDSSSRAANGNRSGDKGWNSLPKEAKEACLADQETLVGEGKRYKTLDDWKKEYARIYHSI